MRRQAGVGILTNPQLCATVLELYPENERVALKRLQLDGRKALNVFLFFYSLYSGLGYPAFLESLGRDLKGRGAWNPILGTWNHALHCVVLSCGQRVIGACRVGHQR